MPLLQTPTKKSGKFKTAHRLSRRKQGTWKKTLGNDDLPRGRDNPLCFNL